MRFIWLSLLISICISGIAFSAQVVTDTTVYFPGQTVTITGSGFAARESVTVQVTHFDGTPSGGQGHDPWKAKANNSGTFTTYWYLPFDDNIGETLLVKTTGQSSGLIATTTFYDAKVVDFRQVSNQDTTDLVWINSILQQNNSTYFEHMSVPQRIIFVGIDSTLGNKHVLTLSHQATKGGDSTHAYDFITSWDQAIAAANFMAPGQNLLSRLNSEASDPNIGPGTDSAMAAALRYGPNSASGWVDDAMGSVLGDNVASRVTAYEVQHGNRIFKVYGSQPVSLCSLVFLGYSPSGGDFYADYRLVWNSASDSILIEFAGRLALGGDGTGFSYGPGKGASQISGGPYHFKLNQLDGASLGSQDNQIKGADVVTPCPNCSISGPDPVECKDTNTYTVTVNGTCTNQSISWSISGNGSIIGPTTGTSVSVVAGSTCNATYVVTATITCDNCVNGVSCSDTVLVNDNTPPSISAPADKDTLICKADTLKFIVCATDNCGNVKLEKTCGNGSFCNITGSSPVCCTLVFFADTSGTYKFCFKATDNCDKMAFDTVVYKVKIDKAPDFTCCPPNQNAIVCNPGIDSLCFLICAHDPDGDSLCIKKLSGTGSFSEVCGDSVISKTFCFKPTTSGVYTFVFEAKEKGPCGKADTCTFSVTVTVDACPAVVTAPDSTKKLCAPGNLTFQVCATDCDGGDTLTLEKCNGNGSFPTKKGVSPVCQSFTFLADTCGTYVFCFKVTDKCGKVDYDTAVWVVEVDKNPPVVIAPDSTKNICASQTFKFKVCASDTDCGDTLTLEKTSGGGTFPTVTGPSPICTTLTFTADTSGTYVFIFKATDECGKTDFDTAVWVIKVNREPIIICPSNGFVTVCTLGAPICLPPVIAYDLDGDSLCIQKISGPGTCPPVCGDSFVTISCCFTPPSSGTYQFSFEAKEKNGCGKADTCMFSVTVKIDSFPPVVDAPDSTKRICQADTIRFTVCASDSDFGDSLTLEKCSGNGSFPPKKGVTPVCQDFKFYADTCGTYKFCFKATDQCGKVDYDTAVWKVEVHKNAPIVTAPDGAKSLCGPDTLKFQVCATDADCTDSVKLEKISGLGSFPMKIGLPPVCETLRAYVETSGTYCFVFKATDECGKTDYDTACWVVTINKKPIITAQDTVSFVLCEEGKKVCFNVSASGGDGDSVCIEKTSGPGNFAKVCGKPQALGQFCWTPSFSDTNKCYSVIFKATDACGILAFDTVTVCILPPDTLTCGPCIIAAIGEDTASPGGKVKIPIVIKANSTDIGGFSFCLEYDPALLTFLSLERGQFFDQPGAIAGSYMWNYLVWRNNPSTVIHKFKLCIIGIGKLYYYGGVCMPTGGLGVLYAEFRLSNNELYRCMRTPIIWERLDPQCIVNAFSNCTGESVFVFDDTLFYNPRICDSTALWPKQDVDICVGWRDGGVVFRCDVDPIVIGDINVNGYAYEIGDAVLFANYFISGPSVFSLDPEIRERQIASTDINRDGLTLSIADLVYLLRILAGDAQPLGGSKIAPSDQKAQVSVNNSTHLIEIHSPFDLGAVLLTFQGEASKLEPLISGLEVKWGKSEGQTKVLIYGMKKGEKIPAGISQLVKIYGDVELVKVEAAEYYGMPVEVDVVVISSKPETYLLSQNYPNPFNANTTIKFATPIDGKVSLKIYNVAGQLVREYQEFMNAGYHSITWDGTGSNGEKVSSGVYLYKLQIGEFSEVRKMTLLK